MPSILFIVSTLKQSGTTIQIYNIAKYITPGKYDLFIITLSTEEEDSMLERFRDTNINIQSLNLSRVEGFFVGKAKLQRLVGQIKPNVIHTQGIRSDSYSIMLAKKYTVVSSMQNYPFFDYPMFYGKIKGRLMAQKQLSLIKKRKNFIACSKSVATDFKKRNNVYLEVIQNGVDTEIFYHVNEREKLELKSKLDIPLDKKLFISVGALIPRKDMSTVIMAFKNSQVEDAILLIAGDGFEYEQLKKIIGQNKCIKLLGSIKNVSEYLQASDYFISASWAEGLPNTVLEAMACRLPVILSAIMPHREVFEMFADYPYFFDMKNLEQLTEHFRKIVLDDYFGLSVKMLNIIYDNFTARMMSEKYQKLYDDLIKNTL